MGGHIVEAYMWGSILWRHICGQHIAEAYMWAAYCGGIYVGSILWRHICGQAYCGGIYVGGHIVEAVRYIFAHKHKFTVHTTPPHTHTHTHTQTTTTTRMHTLHTYTITYIVFLGDVILFTITFVLIHCYPREAQEEVDCATPTVQQRKGEIICLVWYKTPKLHLATGNGT